MLPRPSNPVRSLTASQWWGRRRLRYNVALVVAIVLGHAAYMAVVSHFADVIGRPVVDEEDGRVIGNDIEFGGEALIGQCCGASAAMLLANAFYFLGPLVERIVPARRVGGYRTWAWRVGTAFSCFLPFSVALLHLVFCLFFPRAYERTPVGI